MPTYGIITLASLFALAGILMTIGLIHSIVYDDLPSKRTRLEIKSMSIEELQNHIKTLDDRRRRDDCYARDYVSPDGVLGDPMYGRWLVEKEHTIKRIAILSRKGYPSK